MITPAFRSRVGLSFRPFAGLVNLRLNLAFQLVEFFCNSQPLIDQILAEQENRIVFFIAGDFFRCAIFRLVVRD